MGGWVSWRTVPTFAAGGLATVAGAVLVWWRGAARAGPAVTGRIARWWAGVWLRAAGARVTVSGVEHLSAAGPCVAVSNHQSGLDPIVALRVLPTAPQHLVQLSRPRLCSPARPAQRSGAVAKACRAGVLPSLIAASGLRIRHVEPVRPVALTVDAVLAAAERSCWPGTMSRRHADAVVSTDGAD
jgi:hypothetical protein